MRYVGYDDMRQVRPDFAAPRRRPSSLLLPALLFLSVALLVLSRLDHGYVASLRRQVVEFMSPVLRAAMVPLEPLREGVRTARYTVTLMSELEDLRHENQKLKGWEWRAQELERQLADLGAASKTARDTEMSFITARVIATSSGAFVRSAMINAGAAQNLKPGYPVLSGDGLVGRIAGVGSNAARVMLLTDAQSRIPVFVGAKAVRAVLAGDNGPRPRLILAEPDSTIAAGDEVSTSGIGGVFPRGLRIGSVLEAGERPSVAPHADLDTVEYLGVLLFETPELELLAPDAPGAPEAKP